MTSKPLSFYIHIPYCLSRCGYCDFNTYTPSELGQSEVSRGELSSRYMRAATKEINQMSATLSEPRSIPSIFFGGGTPSLMEPRDIKSAIDAIRDGFEVANDCEITMEANPDTVDERNLEGFITAGVNRFSFGVQSGKSSVLKVLERTHDQSNVVTALHVATSLGVKDLSVDLIYGTPGESVADLEESLEFALSLPINHLSCYALIVEAGTRLAKRVQSGEINAPDDDDMAEKYRLIDARLESAGFDWYELSNWAKASGQSRHNQVYWRGGEWWGVGPGAHSYLDGKRWWNIKSPIRYMEILESKEHGQDAIDEIIASSETLTDENRRDERIMLMIRLRDGLQRGDLTPSQVQVIDRHCESGGVDEQAWREERVVLTMAGRLIADRIVRDLVAS